MTQINCQESRFSHLNTKVFSLDSVREIHFLGTAFPGPKKFDVTHVSEKKVKIF